jgi:hypothetical protein
MPRSPAPGPAAPETTLDAVMKMLPSLPFAASFLVLTGLLAGAAQAQDEASEEAPGRTMYVNPTSLELKVGETAQLNVVVLDAEGNPEDVPVVYFTRSGGAVLVDKDGEVHARKPGEFTMVVRTARSEGERVTVEVPVTVSYGEVTALEFDGLPPRVYSGSTTPISVRIVDDVGAEREDMVARLTSSNESVAGVDAFGRVVAVGSGVCVIEASAGGVTAEHELVVEANPVDSLALEADATRVRTGDVVQFRAQALDLGGQAVTDAPISYTLSAELDDDLGPSASGQVDPDGRFVAEKPGLYTVHANAGGRTTSRTIRVDQREVSRRVKLVGRGAVQDVHTSDLWVWEGVDGKDYAVTGTWGANGEARFWDVTNAADMEQIATVKVDARTINDVKVSPDGVLCIISREGASNRKNGIVIIDVMDPRNPEIISTYTDQLTGGVHNLFIWNDHVFALSAGRRYDIISIEDPIEPKYVSSFELETPGHSIHDVWVVDGIAYSSNWQDGVYMVDVGNGVEGGSLENPVVIGHYAYPSGWNHAAFPYHDEQTGKFYIVAGDEAFPYGLNIDDSPTYPRGWLHFIDFTDPKNPKEVARYEVPEAGSHNFWIEDDVLYVGYYNGGLRVVDISGDLMGNLYEQGREMSFFLPTDPEGRVSNAPMVWGPQPHKGKIFFSDWNSGLWAVELDQPIGE